MEGEMVTLGQSSYTRSSMGVIHILVVDDDPTCLAIVAGILKTWKYNVLAVKNPKDALAILRMNQGLIDLVVTDVHMPDMNGFELQKHVVEEFNLPVIMMSADDRETVILKGLEGGAAFFMVKPISADDVKDIWQYTVPRKNGKSAIGVEETGFSPLAQEKPYHEDIGFPLPASKVHEEQRKKRKEYKKRTPKNANAASKTIKKPKVIWKTSLHNRFLYAIQQIGFEKCVPKKILEFMKVPGLTRENIASHLQKFRIFLRRVADTSDEAARSNVERVLLRSSFARRHSSLFFNNYQENYPQFSGHQQIKRACQPGCGVKDGPIYIPPNKNQANLCPQNHIDHAKYSSFGLKRSNNTRIGDVSNNIMTNDSNGLMTRTNAMPVYEKQAQWSSGLMTNVGTNGLMTSTNTMQGCRNPAPTRVEVFTKGLSSYNFTTNGFGSQNYASSMKNMGSYNGIRSNFNNLKYLNNNSYADTQMTNYGGNLAEYYGDQMRGYLGEAPSGFGGGYFSKAVQQESALVQPPLQESQEKDGTNTSNLFGSIENSSTINSNSPQPITESGLSDIFLQKMQINDQSPNQQGGEEVEEPDFCISSYNVEEPQEIVQPLNQPEGGGEVISTSTQKFNDNTYLADEILSWFGLQPDQEQVGEEFVNSELYGMNQAGGNGDGMVDSLFGTGDYNLMG